MELVLLVAALVLFIIAAAWSWRSDPRRTLIAAGLACWVAVSLVGRL
jgi:hypothetical protein